MQLNKGSVKSVKVKEESTTSDVPVERIDDAIKFMT